MVGSSVESQEVGPSDMTWAPSGRVTRALSSVSVAKRQRRQIVLAVVACLLAGTLAQHEGSSVTPYQTPGGAREALPASSASQHSTEAWRTVEQDLPNPSTEGQPDLLALGRNLCTRNLVTDPVEATVPNRKASGLPSSRSPVDSYSSEVRDLATSSLGGVLPKTDTSLDASSKGLRESTDVSQPVEKGKPGLFPTSSPASPLLLDIVDSSHLDVTQTLQVARAHPSSDPSPNVTSGIAQPAAATVLTLARPPAPEGGPQSEEDLPGTSRPLTTISHTTHLDQKSTSHVGNILPSAETGSPTPQAVKGASLSPEMLRRSVSPPTLPMGTVSSQATHVATDVFHSSRGATAHGFSESILHVSTAVHAGFLPTQTPEAGSRGVTSLQEAVLNGQGPGRTEPATRDPLESTAVPTALPWSSGGAFPSSSHAHATLPDFRTLADAAETGEFATHRLSWHRSVPTSMGSPKVDDATALSASTSAAPATAEEGTEVPRSRTSWVETSETRYGVGKGVVPSGHDLATSPAGKRTLGHLTTRVDFPGSEATAGFPARDARLPVSRIPGADPVSSSGAARPLELGTTTTTTHFPHSLPAVLPGAPFSLSTVPLEREAAAAETPTKAVPSPRWSTTLGEGSTRLGSASWVSLPASLRTTKEQDVFPATGVMPSSYPGEGTIHEWKEGISPTAEPSTRVPGHVSILDSQSEPASLDVSRSFLPTHASSLPSFNVVPSKGIEPGSTVRFLHSWASSRTFEALPSGAVTYLGNDREGMQSGTRLITAAAGKIPDGTSDLPLATSGVPLSTVSPATLGVPRYTDSSSSLTSTMLGVSPTTSAVPLSTDSSSSLTSTMLGVPSVTSGVSLSTVPPVTSGIPLSMDTSSSLTSSMLGALPATSGVSLSTVPPATSGVPLSTDMSSSLTSTLLGVPPVTSGVPLFMDSSASLTSTILGVSPTTSAVPLSTVPPATSGIPLSTDSSASLTSKMLGVPPATSGIPLSTDTSSSLTSTMLGVSPTTSAVPLSTVPPVTSGVPLSMDSSPSLSSTVLGVPPATSGIPLSTDPSSSLTAVLRVPPVTSGVPLSTVAPITSGVPLSTVPPVTSGVPLSTVPPVTSGVPLSTVPPVTSGVSLSTVPPVTSGVSLSTVPPVTSGVPLSTVPPVTSGVPLSTVPPVTSGVSLSTVPPVTSGVPLSTVPPVTSGVSLSTVPPVTSGVPLSMDTSSGLTSTMLGVPLATSEVPLYTDSSSSLTSTMLGVPPATSGIPPSMDTSSSLTSIILGVSLTTSGIPLSTVPPVTSGVPLSTVPPVTSGVSLSTVPPVTSGVSLSTVPPVTSGVPLSMDTSGLTSTMLRVPLATSEVPLYTDSSSSLTSTMLGVSPTTSAVPLSTVPPVTSGVPLSMDSSPSLTSTMLGVPPVTSGIPLSTDTSSSLTSTMLGIPLGASEVPLSVDSSSSLTSKMFGVPPVTSGIALSTVPPATLGVPLSTDSSSLTSTMLGVPLATSEVPLYTDSSSSLTSTMLGVPPVTSGVPLSTFPPLTSGVPLSTDSSSSLSSTMLGVPLATSVVPPSMDSSSSFTSTILGIPPTTSGVPVSTDSSSSLTSTMLGVSPVTLGISLSTDSSNLTSTMLGAPSSSSGVPLSMDSSSSLTSTMLGVPPATSWLPGSTDSFSSLTSTMLGVPPATSGVAVSTDFSSLTSTMLGVPHATSRVAPSMDSSSLTSAMLGVPPVTSGVPLSTVPPATSGVPLSMLSSSTLTSTMVGVLPATSGVALSTDSSSLTSAMLGVPSVTSGVPLSKVPPVTSGVPLSTDSSSSLTSTMLGVPPATSEVPLSMDSSSTLTSTKLGVPPATSEVSVSTDSSSTLTSTMLGVPPSTSGIPLSVASSSNLTSTMLGVPVWKHFAFSTERTRSTPSPPLSPTFLGTSEMATSKDSSEPETLTVSLPMEEDSSASVPMSTTSSNATQFLDTAGVAQPFQTSADGTQHVGMVTESPTTSTRRELYHRTPTDWRLTSLTPSQAVAYKTKVMGTSRAMDTSTGFFVRSTSYRSSSQTSASLSHVEAKSTVTSQPNTTQAASLSSTATDPLSKSRILPTASVWTTRAPCSDVHCLNNTHPASFSPLQRTSAQLPVTSPTLPPKALVTPVGSTVGKKETTSGLSTKVDTPWVTYTTALTGTELWTITSSGPTSQRPVSAPRASTVSPTVERDNITLSRRTLAVSILSLDVYLARIDYTESLANKSSARYKKLEREVMLTLNKILSFYESFLQATVLQFVSGSVIAQTKAVFRGDGLIPTPSDMIRTIVTAVEQREMDASFDWRVDPKSVRCNGFTLKNLDPEVLAVSFTVLGQGSVATFGGLTAWGPLERLRNEVVRSLGTRYQVRNFTLVRVRNVQGDLDINGEIYVNTAAHVDIGWALEALKGLTNYSVDLGSVCINGTRLSLQIFPVSFLVTNRVFSAKLLDRSSMAHQSLSLDLSKALIHTLGQYKNFLQVTIREVRGGSLICYADVMFQLPAPTSKELVEALALSVGPKNYLGPSSIQVDPFSFTVAGATLEPPFANPRIPGYGIALIVLCGLALIIIPLLVLLYKHLGWKEKMVIHRLRDPEVMVETFELDNPTFRSLTEDNSGEPSSPLEALG